MPNEQSHFTKCGREYMPSPVELEEDPKVPKERKRWPFRLLVGVLCGILRLLQSNLNLEPS